MRKPEQRLWDRFHAHAQSPGLLLHRVENLVGEGDPDVEVIARGGRVSKVELKAVPRPPAREATPLLGAGGLSPDQRNYLLRWTRLGGLAYVLVGVGSGPHCEQHLLWGGNADLINALPLVGVRSEALASTWPEIVDFLKRPHK